MKTKVAIKYDNVTPLGGIFYVMDEFSRLGMNTLIDRVLGLRYSTYGYQYSENHLLSFLYLLLGLLLKYSSRFYLFVQKAILATI